MRLVRSVRYKNMNFKKVTIEGYEMTLLKLPSGWITIEAPIGTGEDKNMFDQLVYFNKTVQHGRDEKQVITQVKYWIQGYKAHILLLDKLK